MPTIHLSTRTLKAEIYNFLRVVGEKKLNWYLNYNKNKNTSCDADSCCFCKCSCSKCVNSHLASSIKMYCTQWFGEVMKCNRDSTETRHLRSRYPIKFNVKPNNKWKLSNPLESDPSSCLTTQSRQILQLVQTVIWIIMNVCHFDLL